MSAKEALFHRYATMAHGIAYRLLGHDRDLEDIVQESFTMAFASLRRLERTQAFASWFSTIVTGVAIKAIRERRLLARLGFVRGTPVQLESLISPTAPPDVAAELRAVYALIDALPTAERVVLVLRRVDQLSVEEIVERTGMPLGTVKRKLAAATARLEESTGRSKGGP
jgi:RNA polymerase sigma-70 factor (ECF subfamily)